MLKFYYHEELDKFITKKDIQIIQQKCLVNATKPRDFKFSIYRSPNTYQEDLMNSEVKNFTFTLDEVLRKARGWKYIELHSVDAHYIVSAIHDITYLESCRHQISTLLQDMREQLKNELHFINSHSYTLSYIENELK